MKFIMLALLASFTWTAALATEIGDDGLHKQPWLELTFKDVREDIQSARAAKKRLLLLVEQRDCPYCAKLHETVFADPAVVSFIEAHFTVVQYNLFSSEEVTDLDGEVLAESAALKKWGLHYTPTLVFMPESPNSTQHTLEQAVATMPGAVSIDRAYSMLHWVHEKAYLQPLEFQDYHAQRMKRAEP